MNEKRADVAVIIARFQTPYLHEAHRDLIDSVVKEHSKVIIFLGLSSVIGTTNNPLDFEARKQMIQEIYPDVNILYIKDMRSDIAWSKKLDSMIIDVVGPNQTVALYGSRDSFISRYFGKFKTIELESKIIISSSEIRNAVSKKVKKSSDWRSGVIWSTSNRYPTVFQTVDIAIIDKNKVLLGKKPDEDKYRFIGGFTDPKSSSNEQDAIREVSEETGCEVNNLRYIGSFKIDDWRYRGSQDSVRTNFFVANYVFGPVKAGDDISAVQWFDIDKLIPSDIMDEHLVLYIAMMDYLKNNLAK